MERARRPALPPSVDDLRSRLSRWRAAQTGRHPLSEDLWRDAARLARVHGVSRIATALGLGYYGLKKRAAAATLLAVSVPGRPAFVEVDSRQSLFPPSCVVEVEREDGTKMAIRLSGSVPVDVAGLVASFLDQGR